MDPMMRLRCLLWFAIGFAALAWFGHAVRQIQNSPFGNEIGSVAFPVPSQLEAIRDFGIISFLLGVYLLVRDLLSWRKSR
jgi:hypothetical protein